MTAIRYVRGTLPGLTGEHDIAVLEGDTHISRWVEESRRLDHDQNALPIIGKLIVPYSVVYDVGAFIGDWTAFLASKAKRVYAFEADVDAFDCLVMNCDRYENVIFYSNAVGNGECASYANQKEANKGARGLAEVAGGRIEHICIKLDELKDSPPTLIKLDIEGWEVRALRGAERTIREHHPIIVCEVNRGALERACTSPEELHALLTSYGYEMRDLFTEEVWMPGDARPQFDVICRPRNPAPSGAGRLAA